MATVTSNRRSTRSKANSAFLIRDVGWQGYLDLLRTRLETGRSASRTTGETRS